MATSTWRGRIAFGMVSIPVRLFKAARRERIRFHHVYRPASIAHEADDEIEDLVVPPMKAGPRLVPSREASSTPADDVDPPVEPVARVRHVPMAEPAPEAHGGAAPAPLPQQEILKAFEIQKDRYVVFDPREIAAMRARTSSELVISEFVNLAEIDPVYYDVSYYVAPEAGAEKPYSLLFAALSSSGRAALGSLAMHGREHIAVIRPGQRGMILHTLFYAKEVHAESEHHADPGLATAKEKELAGLLVDALEAPFEPKKLVNRQEERLREMIDQRADQAAPAAASGTSPRHAASPPADILDALRKSIAAARKPARRETGAPPRAQTARRPRKK